MPVDLVNQVRKNTVLVTFASNSMKGTVEMIKLFVGNLPHDASENDIREFFKSYMKVTSVVIIKNRDTGHSRGFGFIEADEQDSTALISTLNGIKLMGRPLTINEASPRLPKAEYERKYARREVEGYPRRDDED